MKEKSDQGNTSLEDLFAYIVNQAVTQKGGKLGRVKAVDEESMTAKVDFNDKSAPAISAKLPAGMVPEAGSLVACLPTHLESEEENSWAISTIEEVKSFKISVEDFIVILRSGTIRLGSEEASEPMVKGEVLVSKINEIINYINTHAHPTPGAKAEPPLVLIGLDDMKSEKAFVE